jgi:hypothetical protein
MARQQRGMNVEAAERHGFEDRLRQDEAVGDDDGGVGAVSAESLLRILCSERCGREHRQTETPRFALNRGRLQLEPAAAARLRRARIDRRDVMAARHEFGQRRQREIRRAHEDEAKRHGFLLLSPRRRGEERSYTVCVRVFSLTGGCGVTGLVVPASFAALVNFLIARSRLSLEMWSMKRMPLR